MHTSPEIAIPPYIPLDMPECQRIPCTASLFSSLHATSQRQYYSRGEGFTALYAIPVHSIPPTTTRDILSPYTTRMCVSLAR